MQSQIDRKQKAYIFFKIYSYYSSETHCTTTSNTDFYFSFSALSPHIFNGECNWDSLYWSFQGGTQSRGTHLHLLYLNAILLANSLTTGLKKKKKREKSPFQLQINTLQLPPEVQSPPGLSSQFRRHLSTCITKCGNRLLEGNRITHFLRSYHMFKYLNRGLITVLATSSCTHSWGRAHQSLTAMKTGVCHTGF